VSKDDGILLGKNPYVGRGSNESEMDTAIRIVLRQVKRLYLYAILQTVESRQSHFLAREFDIADRDS